MFTTITLQSRQFPKCFTRHTIRIITQDDITDWTASHPDKYQEIYARIEQWVKQQPWFRQQGARIRHRQVLNLIPSAIKKELSKTA